MHARINTTRRGYTLVEVLIVVTIIGLAAAVVVPQMLAASSLGVQAAARTLIADLLYAQNEAIAQQAPHRVVIDTRAESYFLQRQRVDGSWPLPADADYKLRLNWRATGSDNLIDFKSDDRFGGITLATAARAGAGWTFQESNGVIAITYDELGAPDQGAAIGLLSSDQRYVVEVAPFTGKVTVQKTR